MHQIILLTALTATSGLFGGGRQQCGTSRCGRPTVGYSACAPQQRQYAQPQQYSACRPGTACGTAAPVAAYPTYAAPQAPVAAPQAPAAPAPQTAAYPSFYYPAAASNCAGGNCAVR